MADRNDRKHRLVEVTAADEIESIQRGDLTDIIGGEIDGKWYAERKSLDAYRKNRAALEAHVQMEQEAHEQPN
jgi:hypothetical protein